jgi:hypothetical protein
LQKPEDFVGRYLKRYVWINFTVNLTFQCNCGLGDRGEREREMRKKCNCLRDDAAFFHASWMIMV